MNRFVLELIGGYGLRGFAMFRGSALGVLFFCSQGCPAKVREYLLFPGRYRTEVIRHSDGDSNRISLHKRTLQARRLRQVKQRPSQ